eukprot:gene34194-biopygen19297
MRVLPYMDDFLVLDSFEDSLLQRERVRRVLDRLGLQRNEKKGQWDPVQVIEHLGLEVDLKHGLTVSNFAAQLTSSSATSSTSKVTVGTRLEVFWEDDDNFYPGVVKSFNDNGAALVVYDDGDEETLNLSEEKFNILLSKGVYEQNKECGGDFKENKRGGDTQSFFVRSLCGRWKNELRQSDYTDLAILMQRRSLLDSTLSNYGPKAERFMQFCTRHGDIIVPCARAERCRDTFCSAPSGERPPTSPGEEAPVRSLEWGATVERLLSLGSTSKCSMEQNFEDTAGWLLAATRRPEELQGFCC